MKIGKLHISIQADKNSLVKSHDLCTQFFDGKNTRKFADEVFLEAMLETRAFCKTKAYLLYFLVRLFAKIKGYK